MRSDFAIRVHRPAGFRDRATSSPAPSYYRATLIPGPLFHRSIRAFTGLRRNCARCEQNSARDVYVYIDIYLGGKKSRSRDEPRNVLRSLMKKNCDAVVGEREEKLRARSSRARSFNRIIEGGTERVVENKIYARVLQVAHLYSVFFQRGVRAILSVPACAFGPLQIEKKARVFRIRADIECNRVGDSRRRRQIFSAASL